MPIRDKDIVRSKVFLQKKKKNLHQTVFSLHQKFFWGGNWLFFQIFRCESKFHLKRFRKMVGVFVAH